MFCKKCGKQIVDDSMFCVYCGAKVGTSEYQDGATSQSNSTFQTDVVSDNSILYSQEQEAVSDNENVSSYDENTNIWALPDVSKIPKWVLCAVAILIVVFILMICSSVKKNRWKKNLDVYNEYVSEHKNDRQGYKTDYAITLDSSERPVLAVTYTDSSKTYYEIYRCKGKKMELIDELQRSNKYGDSNIQYYADGLIFVGEYGVNEYTGMVYRIGDKELEEIYKITKDDDDGKTFEEREKVDIIAGDNPRSLNVFYTYEAQKYEDVYQGWETTTWTNNSYVMADGQADDLFEYIYGYNKVSYSGLTVKDIFCDHVLMSPMFLMYSGENNYLNDRNFETFVEKLKKVDKLTHQVYYRFCIDYVNDNHYFDIDSVDYMRALLRGVEWVEGIDSIYQKEHGKFLTKMIKDCTNGYNPSKSYRYADYEWAVYYNNLTSTGAHVDESDFNLSDYVNMHIDKTELLKEIKEYVAWRESTGDYIFDNEKTMNRYSKLTEYGAYDGDSLERSLSVNPNWLNQYGYDIRYNSDYNDEYYNEDYDYCDDEYDDEDDDYFDEYDDYYD